MRILYLTNEFPYPLTSGYLRHYFLIRELSRQHAVTLLSLSDRDLAVEDIAALRPMTEAIQTFAAARGRSSQLDRALRRLRSLAGDDPAVQAMCTAIERLLHEQRFNVMLLSGKQTSSALRFTQYLPVVVDMCDATSSRIQGQMRYAAGLRRLALWLRLLQTRQIERRLIARAAHLLFASDRDRELLLGTSYTRATIVPNGVDAAFWRRSSAERGAHTLVFTGAMHYPPNSDAALYLVEEILPLVQESVPEAQALIVGRNPPPRLVSAGRRPGVTVTGFVEDVRPYLERATVFVAPLRFGAGIQNKLLEAMAMEVPVITSPVAADGLWVEAGQRPPLQIAADRDQFAALIIQALREHSNQPAPDAGARRFIERYFVWQRSGEQLEQVLHAAAHSSTG